MKHKMNLNFESGLCRQRKRRKVTIYIAQSTLEELNKLYTNRVNSLNHACWRCLIQELLNYPA